jgi:outer membrane protein TolC
MSRHLFFISLLLALFISNRVGAQNRFAISDIIRLAHDQSPFAKQAQTQRETNYWQYISYKTNYNPQLRLSGYSPYTNGYAPASQPDGTVQYRFVNVFNPGMNIGLQQPIPWTGGVISANSSYAYVKSINNINGEKETYKQWNTNLFNVQINQPIFAYNPLKWDRRTKPILYEESKRQFAEQLEFISREAVGRFFDVLQFQVNEQIANFNLANNDTIYKIEQGRYNIGTTSLDKLLQVELQLLKSRQDVAQAKLDLETAKLRLRTYIGFKDGDSFDLTLPEEIPVFVLTTDEALGYAKQNRADFIAFERRRIEAEANVAQAKGQRYQTSITASYGLSNSGLAVNDLYNDPARQKVGLISFNVPVVDWGRRRALTQTALANKRLNDFVIAQDEINFEQEIITQVRQFEMLRLQIEITKKSDEVAQQRYQVAQNRYLIGKIDITNLNIALTEKDNAKRSYIQALKSFWTSYYNLRRLTLYDFAKRQLLYTPTE